MLIQEAIMARTDKEPYIARERWIDKCGEEPRLLFRVLPSNTPGGFLCKVMDNPPVPRWQPTTDDIIATDWFTTC